jgi:hypothetical protein
MKPNAHRAVMASRQPTEADDPDFYPTGPWGGRAGAEIVRRFDPRARIVWECACGAGHLEHGLKDYFPKVLASDKYPYDGNRIVDFLADDVDGPAPDWIITNPPFGDGRAEAFVRRAYEVAERGVALLMRAAMLETLGRYPLLYQDCPLTAWAPFSERLALTKQRWEPDASSAAFYAWFFWLKPVLRPHRFMARVFGEWRPATIPIPPGTEARLTHPDDARLFGAVDRSKAAA